MEILREKWFQIERRRLAFYGKFYQFIGIAFSSLTAFLDHMTGNRKILYRADISLVSFYEVWDPNKRDITIQVFDLRSYFWLNRDENRKTTRMCCMPCTFDWDPVPIARYKLIAENLRPYLTSTASPIISYPFCRNRASVETIFDTPIPLADSAGHKSIVTHLGPPPVRE